MSCRQLKMLSKRASSRSLGIANPSHATFLPFLYQTRSILRAYSDEFPSAHPADHLNLEHKAGQGAAEEQRLQHIRQKWSSKSVGRGRSRSARSKDEPTSQRMQNAMRRPKQLHSIPFEGDTGSTTPAERLRNTTMTPREMQVFEELFRKGIASKKDGKMKTGTQKQQQQETVQFPELLRPLAEEAEELRRRAAREDNKTSSVRPVSEFEIKDAQALAIKSLMDNATSDVQLWTILRDQVFDRLRSTPDSIALKSNFTALPALLQHYMHLQTSKLPTTHSLGLVVLPELKKLGPLAFALGATTELYNQHMHLLWRQYRDMEAISLVLEEMDREVYSFDHGTLDLLDRILDYASDAADGKLGRSVQALWGMDRKKRGVVKMRDWRRTVNEKLRVNALEEAKKAEIGFEDEDDVEEEAGEEERATFDKDVAMKRGLKERSSRMRGMSAGQIALA